MVNAGNLSHHSHQQQLHHTTPHHHHAMGTPHQYQHHTAAHHGTPSHLIQTPSLQHTPSPTLNTSLYDVMQNYLNLISTDQLIQVLTQCDRNNQILDKWLVAIVFEYFQRANLMLHQYTREKFFIALYLAIEFEEDEDRKVKDVLLDYLMHHDSVWTNKRQFIKKKDKYWKRLGFRCMVNKRRLEQIIAIDPFHSIWQRERKESLSGANRSFTCKLDPPPFYKFQWPVQVKREPVTTMESATRALPARHTRAPPEVIDLTQDSPPPPPPVRPPPVPIKPHERKRTSAAYRHLHSIVKLIERDRGRRRPHPDFLKMKQKRLSELQLLDSLGRTSTFHALNAELAHLNVNSTLATQACLNQLQLPGNQYQFLYAPGGPGDAGDLASSLIVMPDRRVFSLDHMGLPSPSGFPPPMVMVPRQDHWV